MKLALLVNIVLFFLCYVRILTHRLFTQLLKAQPIIGTVISGVYGTDYSGECQHVLCLIRGKINAHACKTQMARNNCLRAGKG